MFCICEQRGRRHFWLCFRFPFGLLLHFLFSSPSSPGQIMLLLYWFPTLVCALRIAILARFTGNFEVCCSFPGTLIRRCRFWRGGSTLLISKQKQYDKKHRFRFGKQSTAIRLWLLSKESHSTFQEGKNTLSGKRRGDYVFNSSALFISAFRPWLTWLVEHISVESAIRFDLKGRLLYCLSENKKKRHFGEHGATISPCLIVSLSV